VIEMASYASTMTLKMAVVFPLMVTQMYAVPPTASA